MKWWETYGKLEAFYLCLMESATVSSYSGPAGQGGTVIICRGKVWNTAQICLPIYVKWHSLWKHALQSSLVLQLLLHSWHVMQVSVDISRNGRIQNIKPEYL